MSDQEGEDKYLNSSQRGPEEMPVLTKGLLHRRRHQVVPRSSPLDHLHGHHSESFFVS